jgi:hypothetical protein
MACVGYGGGVSVWQNKKPHRRFGSGVWKILVNNSKPACHAAQQQRVQQQSGI